MWNFLLFVLGFVIIQQVQAKEEKTMATVSPTLSCDNFAPIKMDESNNAASTTVQINFIKDAPQRLKGVVNTGFDRAVKCTASIATGQITNAKANFYSGWVDQNDDGHSHFQYKAINNGIKQTDFVISPLQVQGNITVVFTIEFRP